MSDCLLRTKAVKDLSSLIASGLQTAGKSEESSYGSARVHEGEKFQQSKSGSLNLNVTKKE